jgi:hypothetical protein
MPGPLDDQPKTTPNPPTDPLARPALDLAAAIETLSCHEVRWVMTGSMALVAYGAKLDPGDLDVTPGLDPNNLEALSHVAWEVEAIPWHGPDWAEGTPLDWHYRWSPWPATMENLDHLLVTTVGRLDFVPRLCRTYEDLAPSSARLDVRDVEVLVADPLSALGRLEGRNRHKDLDRRFEIERVRTAVESGDARLTGLDHLISYDSPATRYVCPIGATPTFRNGRLSRPQLHKLSPPIPEDIRRAAAQFGRQPIGSPHETDGRNCRTCPSDCFLRCRRIIRGNIRTISNATDITIGFRDSHRRLI